MIVIAESGPLKIGKLYTDRYIRDKDRKPHENVPYVVLRVATMDEWAAQCVDYGVEPVLSPGPKLFYEISTD